MKRLLLIAISLLVASSAHAQSPSTVAKAKKYFESGKQAYAAGQYRVAAAAFEEAFRLVPRPAILFSAAQSYRRQYFVDRKPRDLKRAVELFKLYVEKVTQGGRRAHAVEHVSNLEPLWIRIRAAQPKNRPLVASAAPTQLLVSSSTKGAKAVIAGKKLAGIPVTWDVKPGKHKVRVEAPGHFPQEIDELAVKGRLIVVRVDLKPKPALFKIKAPSGSTIAINGRTYGTAPLPRDVQMPAGTHYITVRKRGHKPFARDLTVGLGEVADLNVRLRRTRRRRVAYWVAASSVALLGGGVLTTLAALGKQKTASDIRDRFSTSMTNITDDQLADYNNALDARDRWKSSSYALFGTGAALAATATLLWLIDNPSPRAPERPNKPVVVPTAGPNSFGATMIRQF